MKVNAIIVAAGKGERMRSELPKPFLSVAGRPILVHPLRRVERVAAISRIVVVVAPERDALCRELVCSHGPFQRPIVVVHGGAERQDSVRNGLAGLEIDCDIVVIHDAARPFIRVETIEQSIAAAAESSGAIVAIPAGDTIKRVNAQNIICETVPRHDLWLAQTPQTFWVAAIREAHAWAQQQGVPATDDAALVEQMGHRVRIVSGEAGNFKITTPADLAVAEVLLQSKPG